MRRYTRAANAATSNKAIQRHKRNIKHACEKYRFFHPVDAAHCRWVWDAATFKEKVNVPAAKAAALGVPHHKDRNHQFTFFVSEICPGDLAHSHECDAPVLCAMTGCKVYAGRGGVCIAHLRKLGLSIRNQGTVDACGYGLFATRTLRPGLLCQLHGVELEGDYDEKRMMEERAKMTHTNTFEAPDGSLRSALSFKSSIARFANEAPRGTKPHGRFAHTKDGEMWLVLEREVHKGEEILICYSQ